MGRSVVVIGGGISGLAAAGELARAGCAVTLLEAQDRFGGRILTQRAGGEVVELGAEFIHGESEKMNAAVREAALTTTPVSEKNHLFTNGEIKETDLWGRAGKVIEKIDPRRPDESFEAFLKGQSFDIETKRIAMGFVEGFNASDAQKIGAHSLLRANFSAGDAGEKSERIQEGYMALVEDFVAKAERAGAKLLKRRSVRSVRWKRGAVDVEGVKADAAVITLPLGVLKANKVEFIPSLVHKQEAISGLQFGHVIKLVFVFERVWWPNGDFGYIHDFASPIPTWWSDSRGPVLVGWVAGPKASVLLDQSALALRRIGLAVLQNFFGRVEEPVDFRHHNWSKDEFALGAYSYIPVNGLDLPKGLAAPIEDTLFFSGEATAMDAQMGTVSGALETGLRAASEVLRLPT